MPWTSLIEDELRILTSNAIRSGLTRAATAAMARSLGYHFPNVPFNRLFHEVRQVLVIEPKLAALPAESTIPRGYMSTGYQAMRTNYEYRVYMESSVMGESGPEYRFVTVQSNRVMTVKEIHRAAELRVELGGLTGTVSGEIAGSVTHVEVRQSLIHPRVRFAGSTNRYAVLPSG